MDVEVSAAWAGERRRLLDELTRRAKETNGLRAKLAAVSSEASRLRSEEELAANVHAAQTAELQAQLEQAKVQLKQHEDKQEEVLRRCAELQRRAVGVTAVTIDAERQREDIAAMTLECGQVHDRMRRFAISAAPEAGAEAQSDTVAHEDSEKAAHHISPGAIRATGDLFSVLVSLQERLAKPLRQQTDEESAVAEQTASRWELEYAYGRAERQREALKLELASERKAVSRLKQQLKQLASSDVRTGAGALADLEQKLAAALQRNAELLAEKDAAESKLRMLQHDDGGPSAGNQIRVLTRQLAQARAQIAGADEREKVAVQKCMAMEHELAEEKSRYDQLRLQVNTLVAATTNATTAVASPWHSPRLVSRSSVGSHDTLRETPSRRQPQQQQRLSTQASRGVESPRGRLSNVLRSPESMTSYGIDDEVLELAEPPLESERDVAERASLPVRHDNHHPERHAFVTAAEGEPSLGLRQQLFTRGGAHR